MQYAVLVVNRVSLTIFKASYIFITSLKLHLSLMESTASTYEVKSVQCCVISKTRIHITKAQKPEVDFLRNNSRQVLWDHLHLLFISCHKRIFSGFQHCTFQWYFRSIYIIRTAHFHQVLSIMLHCQIFAFSSQQLPNNSPARDSSCVFFSPLTPSD